MRVNITDIRIKKRARKSSGDIQALMDSINKHGIIQPIIVDQNYTLIAGYRRLHAAKNLGYKTIEARIVNIHAKHEGLELEIEENLHRHDFSPADLSEARQRLQYLKSNKSLIVRLWRRFIEWLKNLFQKKH